MRSNRLNSVLLVIFFAITGNVVAAAPDGSGPPPIVTSPFVALQSVARMVPQTNKPLISPRELALFNDLANGRAARWSAADVALLASGVDYEQDRRYYLDRLNQITDEAREATADAATPEEKADALARFLLKKTLHGGFANGQVDMRKVIDEGKFNCVSCSILFDIIARPLGLKTHAVLIPNHIFLRMDDIDIDLAWGKVFSTEEHDAVVVRKQWDKANATVKSAFGNSRTYESGDISLIAQIYYDQGGDFAAQKHYGEAVVCRLKALCLDPRNPLFRRFLEVNLKSWFTSTIDENRLDQARTLAQVSGKLFGNRPNTSQMYRDLAAAMTQRTLRQVAAR